MHFSWKLKNYYLSFCECWCYLKKAHVKADTDCDELEKEKMNQNKENIQEIITTCLEEPQSN